jgi:hypothetical protein
MVYWGMFKRPLHKQIIDNGAVYCPRRGHDVESDVCACCQWRAEFRPDARPPFVTCEAAQSLPSSPSGWHSGW